MAGGDAGNGAAEGAFVRRGPMRAAGRAARAPCAFAKSRSEDGTPAAYSQLHESVQGVLTTIRRVYEFRCFRRGGSGGDLPGVQAPGDSLITTGRNGAESLQAGSGRPFFMLIGHLVNGKSFAGGAFPGKLFRVDQAFLDEGGAGFGFGMQLN